MMSLMSTKSRSLAAIFALVCSGLMVLVDGSFILTTKGNQVWESQKPSFRAAVSRRDLQSVKDILYRIGSKEENWCSHADLCSLKATRLMIASALGEAGAVKFLLESEGSSELAKVDSGNRSAVTYACAKGSEEVLKLLLEKPEGRRQVNTSVHYSAPNLIAAISGGTGSAETVRMLLEAGAEIDRRSDGKRETALMTSALYSGGDSVDKLRLLLDKGANINATTTTGKTALMYAAARGDNGNVSVLLARGANKEARDNDGKRALTHAQDRLARRAGFLDYLSTNPGPEEYRKVIDLLQDIEHIETPAVANDNNTGVTTQPAQPSSTTTTQPTQTNAASNTTQLAQTTPSTSNDCIYIYIYQSNSANGT